MNERLKNLASAAHQLQERLESGTLMREVLTPHTNDIMEQQHIQLLEGKSSDGKDLRPYYTEDLKPRGYFHSRESASRYMAWKETLSYPFSVQRNSNAPNLYINGRFYDEMEVRLDADTIGIMPRTQYAAGIMAKYGLQSFGLTAERWGIIMYEKGVKDEIQTKIKDLLYGN